MSKRYARNPGQDQIAQWKAALAARNAAQRRQRHRPRRRQGSLPTISGPGMVRIPPPKPRDDSTERTAP